MPLTLSDLFAATGFTPNPSQLEAIQHTQDPLFLVAGPGSGKTRVLLWRTVNLIVFHGVRPEEIFLATFTEKAAKQLRDGLLSLLGLVTNRTGVPYDLSRMYVGTVHSLCQRLLADRRLYPGRSRVEAPGVIDPLEQYFLVYHKGFWLSAAERVGAVSPEALRAEINHHFRPTQYQDASRHRATQNLLGFFNRLSEENLEPSTLLAQTSDPLTANLLRLYTLYLERLAGRVDLSLLQQAAYRAVVAHSPNAQLFRHVIVDEYQDTNPIQERLYFELAGLGNLCVVGDDEQALYRFRGATVENFVQFPERVQERLGRIAKRIALSTNYRSRAQVVNHYTAFMDSVDWRRPAEQGGHYRIEGKGIRPHSTDSGQAVLATKSGGSEEVAGELADLIQGLIRSGKVKNANQIAVLFPSLRNSAVAERLQAALEARNIPVFAPRANRFLEGAEPSAVFGLIAEVIGRPERDPEYDGGEYKEFYDWLEAADKTARDLSKRDPHLANFVKDRRAELERVLGDYQALEAVMSTNGWSLRDPYRPDTHKRALLGARGLSEPARKNLSAAYLDKLSAQKQAGGQPLTLKYLINRSTSVDWTLLDLFYRLVGFGHFKAMFDAAEGGRDEGPMFNLSLVSQVIALYMEHTQTILTAPWLKQNRLPNHFFGSYLFARWRLAEGEYEDEEDPFPKGRVPFLTIHQSKGLEFPVVILASTRRGPDRPQRVEELVAPFLPAGREPLKRIQELDTLRMFYVALSRAQNLLVLAHLSGRGYHGSNVVHPVFKRMLPDLPTTDQFELAALPEAKTEAGEVSRAYSYTSDFLGYQHCARSYMVFNRYGFAASRTQTMFFGSLVHQTLEDLHNHLIAKREIGQ